MSSDEIDGKVNLLWETVVKSCNKVLQHEKIYGFSLMDLPDPNVRDIVRLLETVVIPFLDELIRDFEFSPESGLKVANIKTYSLHLKKLIIAIEEGDESGFDVVISSLDNESMIC